MLQMFPVKKLVFALVVSTIALLLLSAPVLAQGETGDVDTGDTTWILLCAALVMLMTPAVGLFYGGMVRKKNANSLIIQSFIILSLVSIQWVVLGYTLSFGSDIGGVIGGLEYAGLVAITPAAGFVGPLAAIAIGIGAGAFSYMAMSLRNKTRIDDSLDVWAIHGVSGTWGAIATGIFASVAVNAGGANGLIYGNISLFSTQIIAVVVTSVYAFAITFVLLKVIDRVIGLRVDKDEEIVGLDISQHGETAYN